MFPQQGEWRRRGQGKAERQMFAQWQSLPRTFAGTGALLVAFEKDLEVSSRGGIGNEEP